MSETDRHDDTLVKKDGALAGAAISAAIGVAVYGLRKALAERGEGPSARVLDVRDEEEQGGIGRPLLVTVWESASEGLLPLAEDAAEAAGRWVAKSSPPLIRERLLPRFIDSFKAAS
ncbi:MAG TPA: hypothetical protein VJ716_05390 [Gaiellaceae bacterium]|nr:hypothetical protein [Gaiellaceae bacterium]